MWWETFILRLLFLILSTQVQRWKIHIFGHVLTPKWGSVFVTIATRQHTWDMLTWLKLLTDAWSQEWWQERGGKVGYNWVGFDWYAILIGGRSPCLILSIYWRRKLSSFLFFYYESSPRDFFGNLSEFFFLFSRLQGGRRRPAEDRPRRHRRSRGRGHVCHPLRAHRARAILRPTQR